jgi:hypothetical protein
MVSMSWEMPSSAKNSHWMGMRTESAASSALSVRRSRAGGQSMRIGGKCAHFGQPIAQAVFALGDVYEL